VRVDGWFLKLINQTNSELIPRARKSRKVLTLAASLRLV
jgi:hypothetical protein